MGFNAIFKQIKRLNHAYFDSYIKLLNNKNSDEKIFYQSRICLFYLLQKARKKSANHKKNNILLKIEKCIEILFATHQLRFRIACPANILQCCVPEMQRLQKNSGLCFSLKTNLQELAQFSESIDAFEALSENTLQIAAINNEEGMAFILFIRDLRVLHAIMTQMRTN